MESVIRGLHHVTAMVDDAQQDVDFYVKALGLRLVKKTVNFDNHNVFHFYYGDGAGNPGTLMTTFPYGGWDMPTGRHGAGQVIVTSFSVPEGSLDAWRTRLRSLGIAFRDEGERFGDEVVVFDDPSGLVIELVANAQDDRQPWVAEGFTEKEAVRGLYAGTLGTRDAEPSVRFLTEVLGWEVVGEEAGRTRLAVNGDAPGRRLDVLSAQDAPSALSGLGSVHHIAMAVADEEAQLNVREELTRRGVEVSPVLDRQYFRSIYFQEPGGVLFEVATLPPGFDVDEDASALGADLKLPPWEEPNRSIIEKGLPLVHF